MEDEEIIIAKGEEREINVLQPIGKEDVISFAFEEPQRRLRVRQETISLDPFNPLDPSSPFEPEDPINPIPNPLRPF